MDELLEWMDYIEDMRQEKKVRHKFKDIIVIVLFATLANVDDWVEMEYFAHYHEEYVKKYIELKNGIPFLFCQALNSRFMRVWRSFFTSKTEPEGMDIIVSDTE